ncbi:MAG: DUF4245 domain-containing protein [Micromonosporaceae bacterium]
MTHPDPAQTNPRRPRDLFYSLAILLIPIGAILLLFQYLGGGDDVVVVDPAPKLAAARQAGLEVAKPTGLSKQWRPTSAVLRERGDSTTLRIGYVSPSGGYAQLIETNGDPAKLLSRELSGGAGADRGAGPEIVKINGAEWRKHQGRGEEHALVRVEKERAIVVLGRAPLKELRTLAASLRL